MNNGCLQQIEGCREAAAYFKGGLTDNGTIVTPAAATNPSFDTLCSEAQDMCREFCLHTALGWIHANVTVVKATMWRALITTTEAEACTTSDTR